MFVIDCNLSGSAPSDDYERCQSCVISIRPAIKQIMLWPAGITRHAAAGPAPLSPSQHSQIIVFIFAIYAKTLLMKINVTFEK